MLSGQSLTISEAVFSVITTFHHADTLFRQLKLYCLARHIPVPPTSLERAIAEAPDEIARRRQRYIARFGPAFEQGDHLVIIALQQVTIQLQTGLLDRLRRALDNPEGVDYTSIIDDTEDAKDKVLSALASVRQRLMSPGSAHTVSSNASPSTLSSASFETGIDFWRSKKLPDPPTVPPRDERRKQIQRSQAQKLDPYPASKSATDLSSATHKRGIVPRLANLSIFPKTRPAELPVPDHDATKNEDRSEGVYTRPIKTDVSDTRGAAHSCRPASINSTHSGESYLEYFEDYVEPPRANTLRVLAPPPSVISINSRPESTSSSLTSTQILSRSSTAAKSPPSIAEKSPRSTVLAAPPIPTPLRQRTIPPIPEQLIAPTPKNNYLGFCKGAWMTQEEDSKAMVERREYRIAGQPDTSYLSCSKCSFRGESSEKAIWGQVISDENRRLKYRWTFLAKSHVKQKFMLDLSHATYQCLFCVLRGQSAVLYKKDAYLEHIAQDHRCERFGVEMSKRTICVNERVCENEEEFDINIYPT